MQESVRRGVRGEKERREKKGRIEGMHTYYYYSFGISFV